MYKKLPYGNSNFADIIDSGYAYVDKTRFVEMLENENNRYQFLVRPRRFGKSLFLSVLDNYYCLNGKKKFDSLFGNLYIGKNPTPERNTYAVMQFDFSALNTDSHEKFMVSFLERVEDCVIEFFKKYKNIFPDTEKDIEHIKGRGINAVTSAFGTVNNAGVSIFAIIDEYDHFANNLIAMGEMYTKEVKAGGIVRAFYEALKIGTKTSLRRIFITGVTPMMLNDLTSGFNMSHDYSMEERYNEIFGFTKEEVEGLMQETGVDKSLIHFDMESYYNGYRFSEDAENKVYNPQMTLYPLYNILVSGKLPKNIVDTNLQTDYVRLRRLAENENNREKLLDIIKDGGAFGEIIRKFSLDRLYDEEYFVSLLFYLGMLTHDKVVRGETFLKIPNYSIKTLYWGYVVSYVQGLEKDNISTSKLIETIKNMAYDGDIKPYLDFFVANYLKRLSNRDLIRFDEKYIKVMMLVTLFTNNFYLPKSEDETDGGYTDIYLQRHPAKPDMKYEYVIELKYAKTDAAQAEIDTKFAEAKAQIARYKKDARFVGRNDIKFVAIVFGGKEGYEVKEIG